MHPWYLAACSALIAGLVVVAWRSVTSQPALTGALHLWVVSAWAAASCLYIEAGIYVVEQDRFSHPNGATLGLLAMLGVLLATSHVVAAWLPQAPIAPTSPHSSLQLALLTAAGAGALGLLYLNLSLSPVPFFDASVDRFDYWRFSRLAFLHRVLGNTTSIIAFVFALGYAHAAREGGRRLPYVVGVVLYAAYLVLIGHKFSALLTAALLWAIPVLQMRDTRFRLRPGAVAATAAAGTVAVALVYYRYANVFNPYGEIDTMAAVLYRAFGLQGHLWWGVWEERMGSGVGATYSVGQLLSGMVTLMLRYGAPGLEIDADRGVTFTGGYPAITLHVFPLVGALAFQMLAGAMLALVSWYVCHLARARRYVEACIAVQLVLKVDNVLTMGSFATVTSPVTLCAVLILGGREVALAGRARQHSGHAPPADDARAFA